MNDNKPVALQSVGLQFEDHVLKAAHLTYLQGEAVLTRLYAIDYPAPAGHDAVKPLDMTEQGKELLELLRDHLPTTAISSSQTLVRRLEVQLKKDKDIDAVINFQAEPLLPYPIDDAVVDWSRVTTTEEGSLLTVFAAKKEHLLAHLSEWAERGVEPEVIGSVPSAIASFANYFVNEEAPYYIVHVGFKNTTCGLMKDGKLLAAQFVPMGLRWLVDNYCEQSGLKEDEALASFKEVRLEDNIGKVKQALEILRLEVMKNLYALGKFVKESEIERLLITGEGGAIEWVREALAQALGKQSLALSSKEGFNVPENELLRFDVPIGLALSCLPKGEMQVNFRKNEVSYPHPWRRLKKSLLAYFAGACALAFATYLCGSAYFGLQKDKLKDEYVSLLAFLNKPYDTFEREYEAKYPMQGVEPGQVVPLEKLDVKELSARLEYLDQEINNAPEPIALMPNTPTVSDVLAWLSTHQNVRLSDSNDSLIHIESFNYMMVKRPEQSKKGGRYQVKVEMEFTSPTPKLARELHDALIEPNNFVEPKGEVKWSSNRGRYRTSFFLKDKTYYPESSKL